MSKKKEIYNYIAQIYHKNLSKRAKKYLNNRGITDQSIKNFQLGLGVPTYNKLNKYYSEKNLKQSLLYDKAHRDMLLNRITIPIIYKGQVLNFTSRALGNIEPSHFHLSNRIIPFNPDDITKNNLFITESPIDCITLKQWGFNSIASLGVYGISNKTVQNFKENIYIVFDTDFNESGQQAALKLSEKLFRYEIIPKIIVFEPTNKKKEDVNSFAQKHTKKDFIKLIRKAIPFNKTRYFKTLGKKQKIKTTKNKYEKLNINRLVSYLDITKPQNAKYHINCFLHPDTKASLCIYPRTNSAYCFGCNQYLNPYSFLKHYLNLQHREIIQKLTEIYGRKAMYEISREE